MSTFLTKEQKSEILNLYKKGVGKEKVEMYCLENNLSSKAVYAFVEKNAIPPCCVGCKHVSFFSSMYPCNICSRPKKDMYEEC